MNRCATVVAIKPVINQFTRLTSMTLSRRKSENGLPLRWATCMGSSTSMSRPSPAGTPWTRTGYTWTTARSSTNARSINLVNNLTQRLSPNGTPTFPQTHDGDSPACVRVHRSSLDEAWDLRQGAGTTVVQPRHGKTVALRPPSDVYGKTMPGEQSTPGIVWSAPFPLSLGGLCTIRHGCTTRWKLAQKVHVMFSCTIGSR
jgi:hypothetical protein